MATAAAQDPASGLAEAEQDAVRLETEVASLKSKVYAREERYRATAEHAAPSLSALHRSQTQLRRLRHELGVHGKEAEARIAQLEDQHRQEVDDHDEEVRNGVGFGLAALIAGLIALAWGWFRASGPVAALAEIDLARAVGICVGGGLLTVIVGAALGSTTGAVGALGSFIFCLGLILPTALLLGRHSAEVQRGRAKPLLRRERLPTWVPMAVAGLMLVLFMAGTGSAIFAGGASSQPLPTELQEEAEGVSASQAAEELEAAREEVAEAGSRAAAPLARRNAAQEQLASARDSLGDAEQQLASAKSWVDTFSQRLVALEEKEQRELERAEARALREVEDQESKAAAVEEESTAGCDYNPCLPPASDYDCEGGSGDGPAYTGTVEVIGTDIYGLDDDGDGIGCE